MAANAASTSFWSFDLLDPLHPATPALGPRWALLVVRLAGLAYFAALFPVQEWAYPGDDLLDANWVQWFTNWSFVVFGLSMLLGAVVTGLTMWPQRGGPAASKPLPRWSALRAAHVLALQVAAGVGLFLSVFYWAALYDPAKGLATPAASVLVSAGCRARHAHAAGRITNGTPRSPAFYWHAHARAAPGL